ncbi:LysR family transcriptional regulator [Marinomonas agarivorans]|nr:LysR family transcriptional regulator [Marinomonas agarivorans]
MANSLRHLNALKAFEAAAKYSSFAKAATELNVSHSVVSQHVKNLEQWLGVTLFVRYGNRIELSDAGQKLLPQVVNAFQTLRDACDGIRNPTLATQLVVCAEPAIASRWLRARLSQFRLAFPFIDVSLQPAWSPPTSGEQGVDIVIHFAERLSATGSHTTQLFPIDGFPACSADLYNTLKKQGALQKQNALQKQSKALDFPHLLTHLPLIHDNGREIWRKWFEQYLPSDLSWEQGQVYADLSLAIEAAVDGEGVILADEILCQKELASGQLIRLDERTSRCTWYECAYDRRSQKQHAITQLVEWLTTQTDHC